MSDQQAFCVGQPFPGPVPHREGAVMELWETGLNVIIQMPNLRREEKQAFKKSFKRYYFLETETNPPVAVWIFDFPKPHGPIDPTFDAKRVDKDLIDTFLDTSEGIKNLVQFYLLDRDILQGIKAVGLSPEAMQLFHSTIKKQLSMDYQAVDIDTQLAVTFMDDTEELMKKARMFRHRKR